ncbi:Sulfurtransferase TusE [Buchnera aphidicola (Eriosoma grossulariae)]|uniref:TusE/DsrC/DsvC family sulfur relay protein n=1 Tax=Buchnera aphidicola TaxID=9 RepID=UPI003464A8C5
MKYFLKNSNIQIDQEGYLYNHQEWNIKIAEKIAEQESIQLTFEHWEIIYFIRNFYFKYQTTPSMRMLFKTIQNTNKEKKITSIYLYKLFPKGPAYQASKIAGIPKPYHCL